MNSTTTTAKGANRSSTQAVTGRSLATLAIALTGQLALPATAGDAVLRNQSKPNGLIRNSAQPQFQAQRFSFTGVYRFTRRNIASPRMSAPHLTTGSIGPSPIKPSDPPASSLGGPAPATAAVSAPAKSHLVIVGPRNPREPGQATRNTDQPATGHLKRISRADIAPTSSARFSEPLPDRTAPAIVVPTTTDVNPATAPARKTQRSRRMQHRRPIKRHHSGSGLPTQLPAWWRNAWNRDGPT